MKSDKAERQGGGVGEEDSVDPHYPVLFLCRGRSSPPLPSFFLFLSLFARSPRCIGSTVKSYITLLLKMRVQWCDTLPRRQL